jgi:hypothetical protein
VRDTPTPSVLVLTVRPNVPRSLDEGWWSRVGQSRTRQPCVVTQPRALFRHHPPLYDVLQHVVERFGLAGRDRGRH